MLTRARRVCKREHPAAGRSGGSWRAPGAGTKLRPWFAVAVIPVAGLCKDMRFTRRWSVLLALVSLSIADTALAAGECEGPPECCVTQASSESGSPTRVRLGLRVMRIEKIAEQDGNYAGELTLTHKWPAGGLRPNPQPRNAVDVATSLDETRLRDGICYRERRLVGTFQTWFRLRRFPFDEHSLRLNLEDREHTPEELRYEAELWPNTISIDALRELTAWTIPVMPHIEEIKVSTFAFPMDAPHPQLILVHIPVVRHSWFYMTRFFVPLLLLVAIAYSIFWVKPEDLGSASAIGITCMLSIIAFQLAQADTLPRVPYLTIADRIYTICYILIAVALACAVLEAYWARTGREGRADSVDRIGRKLFPLVFVLSCLASSLWGWYAKSDADADVFVPSPASAPDGER